MKNKLDVEFHMLNCVTKKKWIDVGNIDLMSFLKATKELCRHPSNLNLNLEGNLRFRSIKIGIWSKNTCSQRIIFKRIGGT